MNKYRKIFEKYLVMNCTFLNILRRNVASIKTWFVLAENERKKEKVGEHEVKGKYCEQVG